MTEEKDPKEGKIPLKVMEILTEFGELITWRTESLFPKKILGSCYHFKE